MASIIDEIERAATHQLNDEVLIQHHIPIWSVEGPMSNLQLISIKIDPPFEEVTNG